MKGAYIPPIEQFYTVKQENITLLCHTQNGDLHPLLMRKFRVLRMLSAAGSSSFPLLLWWKQQSSHAFYI